LPLSRYHEARPLSTSLTSLVEVRLSPTYQDWRAVAATRPRRAAVVGCAKVLTSVERRHQARMESPCRWWPLVLSPALLFIALLVK